MASTSTIETTAVRAKLAVTSPVSSALSPATPVRWWLSPAGAVASRRWRSCATALSAAPVKRAARRPTTTSAVVPSGEVSTDERRERPVANSTPATVRAIAGDASSALSRPW